MASVSRKATSVAMTWQPGAGGRGGRWRKVYKGKTLYYPGGSGRDDEEALRRAVAAYVEDAERIDRGEAPLTPEGRQRRQEAKVTDRFERQLQATEAKAVADARHLGIIPKDGPVKVATVKDAVEAYLNAKRAEMRAGSYKPRSFETVERYLREIVVLCGDEPVDNLTGAKLDEFRTYLLGQMASGRYGQVSAVACLTAVKGWVRWAYRTDRLDKLPRNIDNLKIARPSYKPKAYTVDEAKRIVACASERNRCYLLLMLNCGMYGSDIASIHPDEVNWDRGTITRKRTKTGSRESSPLVTYTLWDETLRLLAKFRSGDPERVVLSEAGTPLWVQWEREDGSVGKRDLILQALKRHWAVKAMSGLGQGRTARHLRKTGASLIKGHPVYHDLADLYLSHAPTSVSERHYTETPQDRFDAAVRWLGLQFGFSTSAR